MTKRTPKVVSAIWKPLLVLFFRYSYSRDAYVLRFVGGRQRIGPILRFQNKP